MAPTLCLTARIDSRKVPRLTHEITKGAITAIRSSPRSLKRTSTPCDHQAHFHTTSVTSRQANKTILHTAHTAAKHPVLQDLHGYVDDMDQEQQDHSKPR
ncbi:MAG: hypothetical protein J3Q66DRAFT_394862 [Benniella sp.]|nr:MAG: hypothetical protein J3Q66DRAFT_394862 [Benniella sp.]